MEPLQSELRVFQETISTLLTILSSIQFRVQNFIRDRFVANLNFLRNVPIFYPKFQYFLKMILTTNLKLVTFDFSANNLLNFNNFKGTERILLLCSLMSAQADFYNNFGI